MGPLISPRGLISQINDKSKKKVDWNNIACGIKLFSFGLFKKMVLADTFAKAVNWGFDNYEIATSADMLLTALFYTFEIYFDFSGYSDMAVGVSKMINIDLPMNFNSPYKATSIRDFWKRWHMSLTGFLTKYIYFPLGGSRKGIQRTYFNILVVFTISGIWHGSNWTFVLWGLIHGILQIIERTLEKSFSRINLLIRWVYTFGAVNILWLLFRSESISQWIVILARILSIREIRVSDEFFYSFVQPENGFIFRSIGMSKLNEKVPQLSMIIYIIVGFFICLVPENNYKNSNKMNLFNLLLASVAFVWAFMCLSNESVFVYFNF